MKTLTTILCVFLKKKIRFYPNSSVVISLVLVLFVVWMSGIVSTCFAQSPWTQKAGMLAARGGISSIVLDGKIYVIGGATNTDVPATKAVQIYDPILNSWTSKSDMIAGRTNFPVCVVNGKIWAIGGATLLWYSSIKSIEEYDPETDTWTHIADMPGARQGHTASLVEGKIYIMGGGETWSDAIAEVDVYDIMTESWATGTDMPTPRIYLSAVVLNGIIYTIGGNKGAQNNETPTTTVEAYDPATDTWTIKANLNSPRKYCDACVLNDKIYVFGGKGGGHNVCTIWPWHVEVYDPAADTWTEVAKTPTRVMVSASVAPFNGKVYVSGGIMHDNSEECINICTSKIYTYNPDHDLYPLLEKIEVDRGYAKPGIDSACITTKINDPSGITLLAEIVTSDQTPVDSLQLFDDGNHNDGNAGDSLYANVWLVSSAEERNYYVDIQVTRVGADTVIHKINNKALFTTIGPVTVDDYIFTSSDTIFNPGDNLRIYLTLKNNSATATATNIKARLISLDTLAAVCMTSSRSFGDIAAGEYSKSSGIYSIKIAEECPVNTQIPILVEITSEGYTLWSDTFSIPILEPVNLEEIREPITRIYPNPTNDILSIEISNTGNQGLEIEILDITGTLIYQKEYTSSGAHFVEQLDLSGYKKGIYLIKARQANAVFIGKVVVR
jgi:N-acetylneuraminic acid mutarotase